MTREEAAQAMGLIGHVESIVATYEPGEKRNDTTLRELKEACRMAVAALRAQQGAAKLDRSRWGCNFCCGGGLVVSDDDSCIIDHVCLNEITLVKGMKHVPKFHIKFCPVCGRPLTEEAWAELERRIGGNDEAD